MTAGYSETPLAKELSLRDGQRVWFYEMPDSVQDEIGEYALDLIFVANPDERPDAAHIFVTEKALLERKLAELRHCIAPDRQVWVSWPKKSAGVETEIDEHDIREAGLAIGFVDTKKCAVDEIWSGLKLVIRKDLR